MKKGLFIVIEGIDGSGKGTQSKLLKSWLKKKGYSVFLSMEPTDGKIGMLLRNLLKKESVKPETLALLFAADRLEHLKEIKQKLNEGKIVISDRYYYSSVAYQGAQGVDKKWLTKINKSSLTPDVVLYLDITPEVGLSRISSQESFRSLQKEKEYLEKKEFLEEVRKNYLEQYSDEPLFFIINADNLLKNVQTSIRKVVGRFLKVDSQKTNAEITDLSNYI